MIFWSALAPLSEFFDASLRYDFLPQALVSLLRGDAVDARMVVLRVVPGKVPIETGEGRVVIQESTGILRGSFYGAEGGLDVRIVIGSSGGANN